VGAVQLQLQFYAAGLCPWRMLRKGQCVKRLPLQATSTVPTAPVHPETAGSLHGGFIGGLLLLLIC